MDKKWFQRKKGKLVERLEMAMAAVILGLLCVLVIMVIAIKVRGTAEDQAQRVQSQEVKAQTDSQQSDQERSTQEKAESQEELYLSPLEQRESFVGEGLARWFHPSVHALVSDPSPQLGKLAPLLLFVVIQKHRLFEPPLESL